MPRYALTIAYDGTDFCGWQKQEPFAPGEHSESQPADQRPAHPKTTAWDAAEALDVREGESRPRVALRTVQHVVEQVVRSIVREPVILMGASRTDAGVHARGQVAAFTCGGAEELSPADDPRAGVGARHAASPPDHGAAEAPAPATSSGWPISRGTDRLMRAINGRLPEDVQVVACEAAGPTFDPIQHAKAKGYSYTLHVDPPPPTGRGLRPLWDRRYVHHVWEDLDVGLMRAAAARIVGEHDFAAFAAAGHGRLTTVRTVFSCEVSEGEAVCGARRLRIDVSGDGFLYNMVRIIAGTLVEAGRGRMSTEDVARAIESKDRRRAGSTLPPTGLCLEWVRY